MLPYRVVGGNQVCHGMVASLRTYYFFSVKVVRVLALETLE